MESLGACSNRHPLTPLQVLPKREKRGLVMKGNLGLASVVIVRVLELSVDAHIERRLTAKDSPAFHRLTGVITAYGKTLKLLVALKKREEFYAGIERLDLPPSTSQYPITPAS